MKSPTHLGFSICTTPLRLGNRVGERALGYGHTHTRTNPMSGVGDGHGGGVQDKHLEEVQAGKHQSQQTEAHTWRTVGSKDHRGGGRGGWAKKIGTGLVTNTCRLDTNEPVENKTSEDCRSLLFLALTMVSISGSDEEIRNQGYQTRQQNNGG